MLLSNLDTAIAEASAVAEAEQRKVERERDALAQEVARLKMADREREARRKAEQAEKMAAQRADAQLKRERAERAAAGQNSMLHGLAKTPICFHSLCCILSITSRECYLSVPSFHCALS